MPSTLSPARAVASWSVALTLSATCAFGASAAVPAPPPTEPPPPAAGAETAAEEPAPPPPGEIIFDRLSVVDGSAGAAEVPGSATVIGKLELAEQQHSDIHRVLRQVPGVDLQEEEGFGLRPNIGMRGSGVERSQKITLLEDGVLIAPAPYAAPAAYYFPTTGRMEAVEVRKGSSSIRQGPYTIGGVLNLVSTSIPGGTAGHVSAAAGDNATRRLHAWVGDSGDRLGWLVETYQLSSDGFKRLDGGGPTGVELEDYTAKLRWNSRPEASLSQVVEVKLGSTRQDGAETYLGLTASDFARRPYRRYAASAEDRLVTDHDQVQLSWMVQPSERFDVTTTVYRNDFFRNWYKLQSVSGLGLAEVLDNPGEHPDELAVLRGEADSAADALRVRANRRDYYARGAQTVVALRPGGGHRLELGVRYHEDAEDRFQEEDGYRMADGALLQTSAGAPGSQSNRVSSAQALAVFVQDRFAAGRWSLTPGLRFESIDYRRQDYGRDDPRRTGRDLAVGDNGVEVWIPGLGVGYRAGDRLFLFAGVHKGFAPPGPGRTDDTEAEESLNYELGLRHRGGPVGYELVAFYNDYDNLLGADTLSSGGGGSGELFNGGAVEVRGLEAALDTRLVSGALTVPLRLSYTYTRGTFDSSFATDFADWAPRVEAGDELPYLPEHRIAASVGVESGRWSTHLGLSWVDEMRTRAGRGPIAAGELIGSHYLVDLSAACELVPGLRAFAEVRNLSDQVYVAARRPAGLRPGLPRTTLAGLTWSF